MVLLAVTLTSLLAVSLAFNDKLSSGSNFGNAGRGSSGFSSKSGGLRGQTGSFGRNTGKVGGGASGISFGGSNTFGNKKKSSLRGGSSTGVRKSSSSGRNGNNFNNFNNFNSFDSFSNNKGSSIGNEFGNQKSGSGFFGLNSGKNSGKSTGFSSQSSRNNFGNTFGSGISSNSNKGSSRSFFPGSGSGRKSSGNDVHSSSGGKSFGSGGLSSSGGKSFGSGGISSSGGKSFGNGVHSSSGLSNFNLGRNTGGRSNFGKTGSDGSSSSVKINVGGHGIKGHLSIDTDKVNNGGH